MLEYKLKFKNWNCDKWIRYQHLFSIFYIKKLLGSTNSKQDKIKFVEDSLSNFYFDHSWIPWPTFTTINILFLLHRVLNKLFGYIFHTGIKHRKSYYIHIYKIFQNLQTCKVIGNLLILIWKLVEKLYHVWIWEYGGECKLEASFSSYYISCTLYLSIRRRKKENGLKWPA